MAIAFIRELRNASKTLQLRVQVADNNRHPSVNGKTYGKSEWLDIPPCSDPMQPTIVSPSNMAVPWSYGGEQRLMVQVVSDQSISKVFSMEIRGRDAWDFIVIRDHNLKELAEIEIGSLGDAPGVNHSWMGLVLTDDGRVTLETFDRQGARRDDLIAVGKALGALGKLTIDMLPKMAEVAVKVLPALL